MTISIDWDTGVISINKVDMTLVATALYELDLDALRDTLRELEGTAEGILYPYTHNHVQPATVGNVTFSRRVIFVNGYTVEFEDDQYGVNVFGANTNLAEVLVRNQVSVNTSNSAGLVYAGFGAADRTDLDIIKKRTGALMGTI